MVFNTQIYEVTDLAKAQQFMASVKELLEQEGGSDIRMFRNIDQPEQVIFTMWWTDAEACRSFPKKHEAEFAPMEAFVRSYESEKLWEDVTTW